MSFGTSILNLPEELLLLIVKDFNGKDLLSFALTCQHFSLVGAHARKLNFSGAYNVFPEDLACFFKTSVNYDLVTQLGFENCYWVPAALMVNAIQKCVNVTVVRIANTKLTSHQHLKKVFAKCALITELSFSIEDAQSWVQKHFLKSFVGKFPNGQYDRADGRTWEGVLKESFELTELRGSRESFSKLVKLDLYMPPDVFLFTSILSACDCLQGLSVTLNLKNKQSLIDNLDWLPASGLTGLLGRTLWEGIPQDALKLDSLQSIYLCCQSDGVRSMYPGHLDLNESALKVEAFIKRCLVKPGSSLKCFWLKQSSSTFFGRSSLKLMPYSQQNWGEVIDDFVNNVESLIMESYMLYGHIAAVAKFIDCTYVEQKFATFCAGHSQLRKLGLKSGSEGDRLHGVSSLSNLRHLTSLSIDPILLSGLQTKDNKLDGKNAPRNDSLLAQLAQCGLHLQELEISSFGWDRCSPLKVDIPSSDLSHIAQWTLLKRLTLGNFNVDNGLFLVNILRKCSMLHSLRLRNIGRPGLCCYTQHLCTALPAAQNLKLLRFEQKNVVPLGQFFDAVAKCRSLVQLALIVPSDSDPFKLKAPLFSAKMVRLVYNLPHLVALHCVLSVPKSHCAMATKVIADDITPRRPSFCIELLSVPVFEAESSLPFVHSNALVRFDGYVSALPYGDDWI